MTSGLSLAPVVQEDVRDVVDEPQEAGADTAGMDLSHQCAARSSSSTGRNGVVFTGEE